MAKNIDVIKAFIKGEDKPKTKNLSIEDDKLINYGTIIAQRTTNKNVGNGKEFIVNITKYSKSTSTIQNKLIAELKDYCRDFETVGDVAMGANRFNVGVK